MARLLLSAGAEEDYLAAFCWYAERSEGAASGFEAEFQLAKTRLLA